VMDLNNNILTYGCTYPQIVSNSRLMNSYYEYVRSLPPAN
jgi:hypothetical protein